MVRGRALVIAVDGLDDSDVATIAQGTPRAPVTALLVGANPLRVRPGGPSEPVPALVSVMTGASVGHTGVATELAMHPSEPTGAGIWYAGDLRTPTLLDQVGARGGVTCALQWPATARGGPVTARAGVDLCLPLVEDLRRYRDRWSMAEQTSSARMVAEHLRPRREAGVHLSQVEPDELVAQIAEEVYATGRVDLAAVRLTGLGRARRLEGHGSAAAARALADAIDALGRVIRAFGPSDADHVVLLPGRPLVPVQLLVHPNAMLARRGLVSTDGPRLADFRALVWPDGARGALHLRRGEPDTVRDAALEALTEVAAHSRLRLRQVDDGIGATDRTDVIAVLDGAPGTLFGLSPTHRPLVEGEDPYYAGPRAVSNPDAWSTALGQGDGLPSGAVEGAWADLGVTLAGALDVTLPGATAAGMCPAALAGA